MEIAIWGQGRFLPLFFRGFRRMPTAGQAQNRLARLGPLNWAPAGRLAPRGT